MSQCFCCLLHVPYWHLHSRPSVAQPARSIHSWLYQLNLESSGCNYKAYVGLSSGLFTIIFVFFLITISFQILLHVSFCYLCFNHFTLPVSIPSWRKIVRWVQCGYIIIVSVTVNAVILKNVTKPCGTVIACSLSTSYFLLIQYVSTTAGLQFAQRVTAVRLSECHPKALRTSSF